MDAVPPPYSDMPAPPESPPPSSAADERRRELILDAVKAALADGGEHRLFRSGKLAGLFPSKAGTSSEAALLALREGLLETIRTEMKGKIVVEWVKAAPKAVAYLHDHDSPKAVLRELKQLLDTTKAGVPAWMEEARREVEQISSRFESRAAAMLASLDDLSRRVEAALRRAEAARPAVAESVGKVVPWALAALEYLDRRAESGPAGDCTLPELFHAVRVLVPELALPEFLDGVRRLHDVRALRLEPAEEMSEPEYAVVVEGKLCYAVQR